MVSNQTAAIRQISEINWDERFSDLHYASEEAGSIDHWEEVVAQ